jgi:hypothetical protein
MRADSSHDEMAPPPDTVFRARETRMSAPLNVQPTSQPSMGIDVADEAPKSGRFSQLITICRRLVVKFFENPRWGVMFTLGRFRAVSTAVVFFHRGQIVRPGAGVPSLFPSLDVESALRNMRRDGVQTDINLDAKTVAAITRFAYTTECYWPADPNVRFLYANHAEAERTCGKPILLGRYFDIEERCDAIRAVAQDPMLHHLAAKYMGAPAGQVETRLWWSFVSDATSADRIKADQGFHYDLHDYRSIAFFFHITDVDESAGPHVHVRGSHTRKPLRFLLGESRQSSEDELVKHYGAQNLMTLCGVAGFGFATDPFGYHKGAPPLQEDRLILRVRFTINDDGSRVDRSALLGAMQRSAVS